MGQQRRGMTPDAFRTGVFLIVFTLILAAANLLFTAREVGGVRAAEASVTQLCQAGNTFRSEQVSLWNYLVTISRPPPHETPAARKARLAATRAFVAYIHKVFQPRNCTAP